MKKIFNSVAKVFEMTMILIFAACAFAWMYLFPKSYQKYQDKVYEEISKIADLNRYAGKHTAGGVYIYAKSSLGRRMYRVMILGGGAIDGHYDHYRCNNYDEWSDEWPKEYLRVMRKYHLNIMKNPTAEIYEAFRIELDPEYKAIVDKVNEGKPLTESERSLYEEIHYQKEA